MKLSKKARVLAAALALTLAAGIMGGCGGDKKEEAAAKKTVNVGIVQLVEHASLDAANKGFVDGLAANGFKEGENVVFDRQNAQADQSNLNTDYIDIGMIHYVDSPELWHTIESGGVLNYALELKAEGKIKHIGVSSHNPLAALEAVKSGKVEVLMFSVNPCYDLLPGTDDVEKLWAEESYKKPLLNLDPKRAELYETCQRLGVGITVMKAFGGGDLLSEYSPAGKALTAVQCLHYALTRPAVAAVMSGARTMEELKASLDYEKASEAEKDYAEVFASFPKISWEGHCMYCGHCAPCPKGIDVANVTKFLNLAKAQGEVPETVREHYAALKAHAGDCIACGACAKRCPFAVDPVANMKEAKEVFGY